MVEILRNHGGPRMASPGYHDWAVKRMLLMMASNPALSYSIPWTASIQSRSAVPPGSRCNPSSAEHNSDNALVDRLRHQLARGSVFFYGDSELYLISTRSKHKRFSQIACVQLSCLINHSPHAMEILW